MKVILCRFHGQLFADEECLRCDARYGSRYQHDDYHILENETQLRRLHQTQLLCHRALVHDCSLLSVSVITPDSPSYAPFDAFHCGTYAAIQAYESTPLFPVR